jgi:hypothetical protein
MERSARYALEMIEIAGGPAADSAIYLNLPALIEDAAAITFLAHDACGCCPEHALSSVARRLKDFRHQFNIQN